MRNLNIAGAFSPHLYPIALETSTDVFFKDKIVIGYSNSAETNRVDWDIVTLLRHYTWEELQYDRETNFGKSYPHDMLYGWVVFPFSPVVKRGASTKNTFEQFSKIHLKSTELPALSALKRLKGKDSLQPGMWILIVRMPRPFAAKITVPFSRRKENTKKFATETDLDYAARISDLKRKADTELHPTEDQLYITRNKTLLQGVTKNIVCTKCGAKGHHHEKTHDDVYCTPVEVESNSFMTISYTPEFPEWMNVVPYPMEEIVLTKMLDEDKGFTLNIRETSTKVPLRLARKLLLDGLEVKGEIHASGVGKRRRILHEAEEEETRANAQAKREPDFQPLVIDMNYEEDINRRFFIETLIRQAREFGFPEYANTLAKQYLDSLDPKYWKPTYLLN
jgi:hypothetical protein